VRHPNLAERSDSFLVVVDMQEPFLRTMFDREMVIENARKLIAAAKILDLPVLVTLQNAERMGDTVPEVKELLPPHEPMDKMSFSCCGDREFMRRVEALGRKTAILTGVEAHICVSQTAHDLLAHGYKVHVPEDGVCSRREVNWRAGLEKMRQSGVVVTSTEAVIFELLGCAGTDEFREVLKIVK
jgi:nicotinamidase-related amidase